MSDRATGPLFIVTLRPQPGTDGIRALKAALKVMGRRFGLRATSVSEYNEADAIVHRQRIKNLARCGARDTGGSALDIHRARGRDAEISAKV